MMEKNPKGQDALLPRYLKYVSATVASLLVFSLYTMVDGLFVSHGVNEYAMSAVNISAPYLNVLFSLSLVVGVGSSVMISVCLGKGEKEEASRLFTQNTVLLVIVGAVVTAAAFLFLKPLASALGADEATFGYVCDYLRGVAPFSVCFIVSYSMEILIKTDGAPQKAFLTVLAGCLCNCVLDYAAIFILDMGVRGAAVATGISQLIVCVVYFVHFFGKKTTFRFTRFSPDIGIYARLVPLGLSDALTEICNGAMILLYNRTILRFIGSDGVVSFTVISYINTLVINVMSGVAAASQPLVSFCHGRGDAKACRRLFGYVLCGTVVAEALITLILRLWGADIVSAFMGSDSPVLSGSTLGALNAFGISFLLIGFNIAICTYLNSREMPAGATAISVGRGFVIQAAVLLILSNSAGGGAIWYTPVISEAVCLVIALILPALKRR